MVMLIIKQTNNPLIKGDLILCGTGIFQVGFQHSC